MTKLLEDHIAELQKLMTGPNGKLWCHTPAVSALIAALEQSQQEKDKWVKLASELGEKCDRLEASQSQAIPALYLCRVFRDGEELYSPCGKDYPRGRAYYAEASQLAVKLPKAVEICQFDHRRGLKGQDMYPRIDIVEMLRAAGITVQGNE